LPKTSRRLSKADCSSSSDGDGLGDVVGSGDGDRLGVDVDPVLGVDEGSGAVVGGAVRMADREAGVERLTSGAAVVARGSEALGVPSGVSCSDGEDESVGTEPRPDDADGEATDGEDSAAACGAGTRSASSV